MLLVLLTQTHTQLLHIKLFTIPIPNIHIHSLPLSPLSAVLSVFAIQFFIFIVHFLAARTRHNIWSRDTETLLFLFFNFHYKFCEILKKFKKIDYERVVVIREGKKIVKKRPKEQ